MTDAYPPVTPPNTAYPINAGGDDSTGAKDAAKDVAGTAKEQASQLGGDAKDAAKNVAGTAKDEASQVAGEAKKQAKALYAEARTQLTDQAGAQQGRAAQALHGIGDELGEMSQSSQQPGLAAELVGQVASRARDVATWLEDREPADVLREVQTFARRKPGTFIALCAIAGLVAGRLVRSLTEEAKDDNASTTASNAPKHAASSAATSTTAVEGVPATSLGDGVGQSRSVGADAPFLDVPPPPAPGTQQPAPGTQQPFGEGRLP